MSPTRMTSRGAARARRGVLAVLQATLSAVLIAGVAWAGTQPAVIERLEGLDLTRATANTFAGTTTEVALERSVLVCPGPELVGLAGARDLELETSVTVVAAPDEVRAGLPVSQESAGLDISPLGDVSSAGTNGLTEGSTTTAPLVGAHSFASVGVGAAAAGLLAGQEAWADTEEVRGLATVACQQPAPSAWILGGGGGPGRAERLIISNPGSNAITASVVVFGAEGKIQPADGQHVAVPPLGRTVLLADALAPDEASPVFAVTVTGGDAVVTLVETAIDGTAPIGFDTVSGAQAPELEQVIPAVLVPSDGAGSVTVRIVNPGESEAIGTISVLTAAGELALPDAVVRLPAESVVDVPVEGVPPGPTSLVVNADAPVVAGARTVEESDDDADAGWSMSQAPMTAWAGAAIPDREGILRRLVLSARGVGSEVTVIERRGDRVASDTVLIPRDGTVVIPVEGEAVWVRPTEGAGSVVGAVLSTADAHEVASVSVLPLVAPQLVAHSSEVVPLG